MCVPPWSRRSLERIGLLRHSCRGSPFWQVSLHCSIQKEPVLKPLIRGRPLFCACRTHYSWREQDISQPIQPHWSDRSDSGFTRALYYHPSVPARPHWRRKTDLNVIAGGRAMLPVGFALVKAQERLHARRHCSLNFADEFQQCFCFHGLF
jgi:hypothetical protein